MIKDKMEYKGGQIKGSNVEEDIERKTHKGGLGGETE